MYLRCVRWSAMLVVCLLLSAKLMAQPWHQLTMNDFQGNAPGTTSAYIAYTNCQITYNYVPRLHNGRYYLDFDVSMEMNHTKSWMNKAHLLQSGTLDVVLRHEQGHYNMAYLEQRELLQAFVQAQYGADYATQVKEIFNTVSKKYQNLNQEYELSSMHSLNREKQNEWDNWFRTQINDNYRSYTDNRNVR